MARRPKPKIAGAASAPPKSNVTDEVIRLHIARASKAREALDVASGEYRASLKSAKAAGIDPGVITWYLATRRRDIEDVDRETALRTRVAAIMKLPIGTQLGLFDNGMSVASDIELPDEFTPYKHGQYAYDTAVPRESNPFAPDTESWAEWDSGWYSHAYPQGAPPSEQWLADHNHVIEQR